MDGNEQQLYFLSVTELKSTEQVIPSEGEQASASFLKSLGQIGHGDAASDEVAFLVLYHRQHLEVQHADVLRDESIGLLIGMRCIAEELAVRSVEQMEDLASVTFLKDLLWGQLLYLQPIHVAH